MPRARKPPDEPAKPPGARKAKAAGARKRSSSGSRATGSKRQAGASSDTDANSAGEPEAERGQPRRDATTGRLRFPGLSPRAYEHPPDRAALAGMRRLPGCDTVLRSIFGLVADRSLRLLFLGSAVRVSARQFPAVHRSHLEACRILDLDPPPELYVAQTPFVNAGAIGVERPFVVLNSGTLGLLDDDELRFLLGHELGHVLSGHALYKTMLRLLLNFGMIALSVPMGGAALIAIRAALLEWDRKSELSADRAGLLVVQDPEVALRVQMKLAGGNRTDQMDVGEFIVQAEEYAAGGNVLDSVAKLAALLGRTHPFPVLRLAELRKWVDSGAYHRLLADGYPLRTEDRNATLAEELRASGAHYREEARSSRDPLVRLMREIGRQAQAAGASLFDRLRRPPAGG